MSPVLLSQRHFDAVMTPGAIVYALPHAARKQKSVRKCSLTAWRVLLPKVCTEKNR